VCFCVSVGLSTSNTGDSGDWPHTVPDDRPCEGVSKGELPCRGDMPPEVF
jgi:hypothetical protein